MAKVISVGIQKGGCGKSTTASILVYQLSQKHKVLAVDMDGQGNLTQLLTGSEDIFEFGGTTVYDAILAEDATEYVLQINPNLHILSGDENVNTLAPYFHVELKNQGKEYHYALKNALDKIADNYDYIIIDNPPALGELSIISLTASDYVLIMFETSKFCYSSLRSYLKTIEVVKDRVNGDLKIAGIVRNLIDGRRSDNKYYSNLVKKEYGELCLDTVIKRSAIVGKLPALGFKDNNDIKKIMKEYQPLIKELMSNVI
ncbi:ParA family protein [Peribacillus sp. R9-11]|uniref:ParA family protein n=1 Tax=Peribacillus sp. R9-11 TaxID=3073271 RepID=UPI0028690114|nr:ParA family protein [Peribacillus sp. R9-11]WMX58968.1 ParA family protein [Peribacillus sp. R9-11]